MVEVIKMTDISVQKSKPKYSTLENTIYLIKNIWKWEKFLFLLCILQIPATVIIPLLGIYLPKVLIFYYVIIDKN